MADATLRWSFNSLFEMREIAKDIIAWTIRDALSILYLRCGTASTCYDMCYKRMRAFNSLFEMHDFEANSGTLLR